MAFQLGCMTNAYLFAPLEDALIGIAESGFRNVEIMCDRPHMYPDDFSAVDRQRVKTLCAELGLTIVGLDAIHINPDSIGLTYWKERIPRPHFYPDPNGNQPMFTNASPELRKARIDYVKKVIDMAAEMGVTKVETFTGEVTGEPDVAAKNALAGIRECALYAEQRGVTLVLELSGQLMYGTPDEMIWLIDEVGSPNLKCCVDIGHLECERYNIPDTIWKLRRYVGNFHIDDMQRHKHYHLIPGRGVIDWAACLSMIDKIGYEGAALLELYPYALDPAPALKESLNYLSACR